MRDVLDGFNLRTEFIYDIHANRIHSFISYQNLAQYYK